MITAMVNTPHPDRIQLLLGSLHGPLFSDTLGAFDPRRDVAVYLNGRKVVPKAFTFDSPNNRYLLFLSEVIVFDPPPIVQLLHHMPSSPFISPNPPNPILSLRESGLHPDILVTPVEEMH